MANIYVRKSGNDSNDGSTPALAKLTIAGAISVMASDDIIRVGAGIYREQNLESGTKHVHIYGDKTGEYTGDAGEVIWSGMNSDDTALVAGCAIRSTSAGYDLDIQDILFENFSTEHYAVIYKTAWGNFTCKNLFFNNCFSLSGQFYGVINYNHSTADTEETIHIENIQGKNMHSLISYAHGVVINTSNSTSNNLKFCNVKIESLNGKSSTTGVSITFNGTIIDRIENIEVNKITDTSSATGIRITSSSGKDIYNSIATIIQTGSSGSSYGIMLPSGQTNYAYNCSVLLSSYGTAYSNTTQSNCVNKANYHIPRLDDISRFSPLKGAGNTSFPTTDIKGNPRPAYGNGTACDIGAIESTSDIIQKESTIKDSGDYSIKVSPCNYFKKVFQVPVEATKLRTVKVKIRIDGTWGTYLPRVSLSGQGMTLSQDTKNSTTGSFEELTVSGTPTTTGIALLTIEAHSPNTDAAFYIDTITIE